MHEFYFHGIKCTVLNKTLKLSDNALYDVIFKARNLLNDRIEHICAGGHWVCAITLRNVVKSRHNKPNNLTPTQCEWIAEHQSKLSVQIPGILPISYNQEHDCFIEARAPGHLWSIIRDDQAQETKAFVQKEIARIEQEMVELRYKRRDVSPNNTFFCPETQRVTLIDFETLKKI